MKLRTIARTCLFGTFVGVLVLGALGVHTWRQSHSELDGLRDLIALRTEANRLGVAVDYLTLLRGEPVIANDLAVEARQLAGAIARIEAPMARIAVLHLVNIAEIADVTETLMVEGARAVAGTPAVGAQLRVHAHGVTGAIDALIDSRQAHVVSNLVHALVVLVGAAVTFAALCLLASFVVYRRVIGPVEAITRGIESLERARPDFLVREVGQDELGVLAASFNRMAAERQRREDELRESEERFRQLAENIAEVFWLTDLDQQRMIYVSPAYERVWGRPRAELYAQADRWMDALHDADRERVLAALPRQAQGDYAEEYRIVRPDGSVRWILDRASPVRDATGKVYRIAGVAEDITARRLWQDNLQQSQRLEALGQLTGGVAHDFNNLLTVILGNAELLVESLAQEPRGKALASMVAGAAQRAAELTRALLAFARKQALDPKPVDVNALLAGMEPLLQRTLGEQVEIRLLQGAGLGHAFVDPAQLESAVLNLCINARDAMPQGGRLTIETRAAAGSPAAASAHDCAGHGRHVLITINDTGHGISPDLIGKVFEPFVTTKDKGKGTGLGLPMVYGFAKQSGGDVAIESTPGQGTTVHLRLPCVESELAPAPSDATDSTDVRGGNELVLLVEDDAMVRRYAASQLHALGYRVVEAQDGPSALRVLQERSDVDLLFTDVVMPGGMSGRDLADEAVRSRPALKVLFASGYAEDAIVHHGRLDPGVRLLSKPYRRSQLAEAIRRALHDDPLDAVSAAS